MTESLVSSILEIDQLIGAIEHLQNQKLDTSNPYAKGMKDGRDSIANHALAALTSIRQELMELHLNHNNRPQQAASP
ncbi:hypothetical protein MIB92_13290 [Aestuariirhabdus sp. Z084]|uniref:hypothetical protein n=1 Tax=Aestuariirhabdus haliotis TaxID=2918751 RepID=UPI00201B3707|nr:hypothetical protein [Aestuariirhabdus haliotis]MCL6416628.1 hypothetical protein [Aestuariirhabdus haliotis]MCL6420663.1 hypothetical protein [Aestuariirhabdus haliotis]